MKFLHSPILNDQKGTGVIEVLVALAMASIIIVSIGNVLSSVHARDTSTALRERALAHAKESLEIVENIQSTSFACSCGTDSCAGTLCTKTSDAQTCSLPGIYTTCWTTYPDNLTSLSPLHLELSGTEWTLVEGMETIATDPVFTRTITIVNVERDGNGNIVESGGTSDLATKKVTTRITWLEKNVQKELQFSTLLTAWENL